MMTSALLQQWIEHPELLDGNSLEELRRLVDRFPYFQSARLLYLRNLSLLNDGGFGEELRRTAPFVADRRVLFHLIKGYPVVDSTSLSVSVEEEPSMDRTLSLIDDFLAQAPEEATAEQSVGLDYAMDYTSFLLQENESADREEEANTVPPLRGQDLIDGFIREQELARTEQPQVPLPVFRYPCRCWRRFRLIPQLSFDKTVLSSYTDIVGFYLHRLRLPSQRCFFFFGLMLTSRDSQRLARIPAQLHAQR